MFQQATPSDSGNYTCAPANYRQHSVIVNVIKGEESPFSIFFLSQYQNVNLHPEERLIQQYTHFLPLPKSQMSIAITSNIKQKRTLFFAKIITKLVSM